MSRTRSDHEASASSRVPDTVISEAFVRDVCDRLAQNKQVRRTLPTWGRIHIDRQVPFLCVYRRSPDGRADGTENLVSSEASYLAASGGRPEQASLKRLVREVSSTLAGPFGAFLILELWEGEFDDDGDDEADPARHGMSMPRFRIVMSPDEEIAPHIQALARALAAMRIAREPVHVEIVRRDRCAPPGLAPIMTKAAAGEIGCSLIGLEVRPVYRNPETGKRYPLILRAMQRSLTRALRRGFYEFSCTRTTHCPTHYHMLGRQAVVKAVWTVDEQLAAVSNDFDLLLQVSPINVGEAWREFRSARFDRAPAFRYRPLPIDPVLLKRRLYQIPVERVEDPVLFQLFREKQDELDRQLTLLHELNTDRFALASVLLYGRPGPDELRLAGEILDTVPPRSRDEAGDKLDSTALARLAEAELARYRAEWPEINAKVKVRDDLAGGMMVSRGSLLVSRTAQVPAARAPALIQHEVGTHVVTYYNGRAQPFKQLYSGLAGYESLQEGLAVLSEYLVGGLSRPRMRLLAARVVAVHSMLEGASFVETFRQIDRDLDFSQRTAFQLTMRVFRGGGLAKDAIYLRGLKEVLDYLATGKKLEPLFVGKLATKHIPVIRELQLRGILRKAPLRPHFLDAPGAAERLERVRKGISVLQLVERAPRRNRKAGRR